MLLIGYGNPGRGDDGLGQALAARIEAACLPGVQVLADYQLTVDHAPPVAAADRVVFADALMKSDAPFEFDPVTARDTGDLTSHSLRPGAVLSLAETLFGATPRAWVLGITGTGFGEVKEGLSPDALGNLDRAEGFIRKWIVNTA